MWVQAVQLMREEMTQRINVCFEGLLATIASTPCRAKSETHLHSMVGDSMSHLYTRPYTEAGLTLSEHVSNPPARIIKLSNAQMLGAFVT